MEVELQKSSPGRRADRIRHKPDRHLPSSTPSTGANWPDDEAMGLAARCGHRKKKTDWTPGTNSVIASPRYTVAGAIGVPILSGLSG